MSKDTESLWSNLTVVVTLLCFEKRAYKLYNDIHRYDDVTCGKKGVT